MALFFVSFLLSSILIFSLISIGLSYYHINEANKKFSKELKGDSVSKIEDELFGINDKPRLIMMIRRSLGKEVFWTISANMNCKEYTDIFKFLASKNNKDALSPHIKAQINSVFHKWSKNNGIYLSKTSYDLKSKLNFWAKKGALFFKNLEIVKFISFTKNLNQIFADNQNYTSYWLSTTKNKFFFTKLVYTQKGNGYEKQTVKKYVNDDILNSFFAFYIKKISSRS